MSEYQCDISEHANIYTLRLLEANIAPSQGLSEELYSVLVNGRVYIYRDIAKPMSNVPDMCCFGTDELQRNYSGEILYSPLTTFCICYRWKKIVVMKLNWIDIACIDIRSLPRSLPLHSCFTDRDSVTQHWIWSMCNEYHPHKIRL